MSDPVTILVGTVKGAFLLRSGDRGQWQIDGPQFKGWKVTAAARLGGKTIVATASDVYGAALHTSENLTDWTQVANGPAYADGADRKLRQIWTIVPSPVEGGPAFAGEV